MLKIEFLVILKGLQFNMKEMDFILGGDQLGPEKLTTAMKCTVYCPRNFHVKLG